MRLTRNETDDGSCKYALIRLDKMREDGVYGNAQDFMRKMIDKEIGKYIELAGVGSPDEAFVVKLKDINSPAALGGYAGSCNANGDSELADDVILLTNRAGKNSPFCKNPD